MIAMEEIAFTINNNKNSEHNELRQIFLSGKIIYSSTVGAVSLCGV